MSPCRASSEVRATRMKCAAPPAPVMNHLWPWITQLSPFFSARVGSCSGSEPPPGAGSVMAKEERTLPSTMGRSHFSFCASACRSREQVHIAVVGRRAIERQRPEDRTLRFLVHRGPADDRQRHPADTPSAICGAHSPAALALACTPRARRAECSRARRNFPRRFRAATHAPRRTRACAGGCLRSRATA